jgi:hypothetical protein
MSHFFFQRRKNVNAKFFSIGRLVIEKRMSGEINKKHTTAIFDMLQISHSTKINY